MISKFVQNSILYTLLKIEKVRFQLECPPVYLCLEQAHISRGENILSTGLFTIITAAYTADTCIRLYPNASPYAIEKNKNKNNRAFEKLKKGNKTEKKINEKTKKLFTRNKMKEGSPHLLHNVKVIRKPFG